VPSRYVNYRRRGRERQCSQEAPDGIIGAWDASHARLSALAVVDLCGDPGTPKPCAPGIQPECPNFCWVERRRDSIRYIGIQPDSGKYMSALPYFGG